MGVVYRARDTLLERFVALEIVYAGLSEEANVPDLLEQA
jgi:hypothetical protein